MALPDNEYPKWLWSCLDVTKGSAAEEDADAGDEFCTFPYHIHSLLPRIDVATSWIIMLTTNSTNSEIQEAAPDSSQAAA